MSTQEDAEINNANFLDKFHEIEIQKVSDILTWINNVSLQVGTFFGTANITALGVAFTLQKAGILFFAALLILLFIVIEIDIYGTMLRYYYRALILRKKFAPNDEDTFLDIAASPHLEKKMRGLIERTSPSKRLRELRKLQITAFFGEAIVWIALTTFLVEIGMGIVLSQFPRWSIL